MFPTRFSLAEILVLAGTAGAGGMAPPASTRISARLKRDQEHSSPVNIQSNCSDVTFLSQITAARHSHDGRCTGHCVAPHGTAPAGVGVAGEGAGPDPAYEGERARLSERGPQKEGEGGKGRG